MVSACAAHRKAVKRDEAGGVRARNQGAADDILLVAGKLAPESRLEVHVLAHGDGADIRQRSRRIGSRALKSFDLAAANQKAEMMVAEAELAGANGIASGEHFSPLGRSAFIGAPQPAKGQVDTLARRLTL